MPFVKRVFLIVLFAIACLQAAPQKQLVQVIVSPDHADWTYEVGEKAEFYVMVLRYGLPVEKIDVEFDVKKEQMKESLKKDRIYLKRGRGSLGTFTLDEPGFIRCWATVNVDGKEYKGYATAGFSPGKIKPTVPNPDDFDMFWDKAKIENSQIPMNPVMTLMPEKCTEKSNVYHVSLQNFKQGSRIYGILTVPKAAGKYPAILRVPGAGARPYNGMAWLGDKGVITFEIGIHGVPVTMDRSVYDNMMKAAIDGYWMYNMDDRDSYYYKRVYLGCVRSVDFIFSLPQFDGENLAVNGGSQGGALSIVTAGLDKRIQYVAAYYPALCDLTGYVHDRAGGWPHMTKQEWYQDKHRTAEKLETLSYYDVVNFARRVQVPGIYCWGYNDNVCPPTSMHAAYNVIRAEKELWLTLDTGHWTYPEQGEKSNAWILEKLGVE